MPDNGAISGGNEEERAVALAGWIAEQGVCELTLDGIRLSARTTDLPGEIVSALRARGRVVMQADRLRVEITPEACSWARTTPKTDAE